MADDIDPGDENETVESLTEQLASLAREHQRLTRENARRKATYRDLKAKLAAVETDLQQSHREQDSHKTKADSNPSKDSEELDSLRAQVLSFQHRDSLSEIAYSAEIGLNKSITVEKLMRFIDYKPTGEFDAKAVKETLLNLKKSDPYLFGEQKQKQQQQPVNSSLRNGASLNPAVAALGQGTSNYVDPNVPTEEQARDPAWMSRFNAKKRTELEKQEQERKEAERRRRWSM